MQLTTQVTELTKFLGYQLKDFDKLKKVCDDERNFIPFIQAKPWDGRTLSHGYPALITYFAQLDTHFPGENWEMACHHAIEALVQEIERDGIHNGSLFSGLTGIAFSVLSASKEKTRYSDLLHSLNTVLAQRIQAEYLTPWEDWARASDFLPPAFWDVIVGASGIMGYLYHFPENPEFMKILETFVDKLSVFKESASFQGSVVPRWFSPAETMIRADHQTDYAPGCCDVGVAHGISGLISTLCKLSALPNLENKCKLLLAALCPWVCDHLCEERFGCENIWQGRYVLGEEGFIDRESFYRDGWCYGAPGIARALFLAAQTLNDNQSRAVSEKAFSSLCTRIEENKTGLRCPSFCHGFAGLLTIMQTMYLDTQETQFLRAVEHVEETIIKTFSTSCPFGFPVLASLDPHDDLWIDSPGILDGSVGIGLSLLQAKSKEKALWVDYFAL